MGGFGGGRGRPQIAEPRDTVRQRGDMEEDDKEEGGGGDGGGEGVNHEQRKPG